MAPSFAVPCPFRHLVHWSQSVTPPSPLTFDMKLAMAHDSHIDRLSDSKINGHHCRQCTEPSSQWPSSCSLTTQSTYTMQATICLRGHTSMTYNMAGSPWAKLKGGPGYKATARVSSNGWLSMSKIKRRGGGGGGGGGGRRGSFPPKQLNFPPKLTQLPPQDIANNYNYEVYPPFTVALQPHDPWASPPRWNS